MQPYQRSNQHIYKIWENSANPYNLSKEDHKKISIEFLANGQKLHLDIGTKMLLQLQIFVIRFYRKGYKTVYPIDHAR